jgi:hypothetical protein
LNGGITVDTGTSRLSRMLPSPILKSFFIHPEIYFAPFDEGSGILSMVEDMVNALRFVFHTKNLERHRGLNFHLCACFYGTRASVDVNYATMLTAINLSSKAPLEVRRAFLFTRNAMCYGYWYYPLFTIATDQLLRIADFAATEAAQQYDIKPPKNPSGCSRSTIASTPSRTPGRCKRNTKPYGA